MLSLSAYHSNKIETKSQCRKKKAETQKHVYLVEIPLPKKLIGARTYVESVSAARIIHIIYNMNGYLFREASFFVIMPENSRTKSIIDRIYNIYEWILAAELYTGKKRDEILFIVCIARMIYIVLLCTYNSSARLSGKFS